MIKANFHTHTVFCDGMNTAEEMVRAAIALGMTAIGFSGHSYSDIETYGMKPEVCANYRREILRLKKSYAGQIEIYLGLEQDSLCPPPDARYDYLIGAVHAFCKNGQYLSVDESEQAMVQAVRQHYDGDYYAYAEDYYRALASSVTAFNPDFIAHVDLVTKYNENGKYFDESNPRYRKAALSALEELKKADKPFEINTGAMSRGYRTAPYPAPFLLKAIREMGGRIILSSDAHCCRDLLSGFEQAAGLARACGFRSALVLTKNGWTEEPL